MDAVEKEITLQDNIENPEFKALFSFIFPHLKLPDQKMLSNYILISATNEVQTTIKELACQDKIGITIAFDGWRNVVNQELMDIVFITSSGETLIWRADDINIERQRQEEVIARIHMLFEETKELNIRANRFS
ncbi:18804_t:CDS:2 [Racocetra fulgida]|uniref:18804_t:CDS:1 n=1 Tax=Racocetra fulgida TaxID=60492 RepID=A0A9N8WGC1_9GLOM|nr:18804_t:CDS:2 [Racocetra fulgida]